ncbi:MAG TPA: sulfatase-like hydrolase/transferase [Blastocatellia bacterium]|nr:sulfatase-like hydrolase/transferase [Blastocatellia bacterium]
MKKSQMIKDAVGALSLANLCFILGWSALLDTTLNIPGYNQYLSIIISVLSLALLLWIAITLARRSKSPLPLRIAELVFPLSLLVPFNCALQIFWPEGKVIIEIAFVALAILIISISDIKPWDRKLVRFAATATLILSPFVLLTIGQAAAALTKFSERPLAQPVAREKAGPRVLWMVFDEMDYQIAFSIRPASLELPEFDRFRNEAIIATHAYPPADSTGLSMPALITGRRVVKTDPISPSEITITFDDANEPVSLSQYPTLFSKAREANLNTAVIGWYIPYGRVIGKDLNYCVWQDVDSTLRDDLLRNFEDLVNSIPLGTLLSQKFGIKPRIERQQHLRSFLTVQKEANRVAADPNYEMILVHWPMPHPPYVYNRRTEDFDLSGAGSYLDNLRLADRALGELRQSMEDAGIWDDTIVLVTSDHWWKTDYWQQTYMWAKADDEFLLRETDHRVPFLLKLAGQKQSVYYEQEFDTILTQNLLLELLKGDMVTPDSVAVWLDRHRSTVEITYRSDKHD